MPCLFFNDPPSTAIYTLSLHDALPICRNFEITPDIRALIETKLAKIEEKLFSDVIDVRVVLQVEKYRNICEILIKGKEHDVDRKSTRLNSSHGYISYAVFCLKKKKIDQ